MTFKGWRLRAAKPIAAISCLKSEVNACLETLLDAVQATHILPAHVWHLHSHFPQCTGPDANPRGLKILAADHQPASWPICKQSAMSEPTAHQVGQRRPWCESYHVKIVYYDGQCMQQFAAVIYGR